MESATPEVERAVRRAARLLRDALAGASAAERRRQRRLGRIVDDPAARDLVQRLTDEVLRITDDEAAARRFRRLVTARAVPRAFGAIDRALLRAGAGLADALPHGVMPLVRRRIVAETRGLVISAQDPAFGRHVATRRGDGVDLNINLLGEAILSDDEAADRVQRVLALIERRDVDYVSVKISALCAQLDVAAFEHSVERIVTELRRIFVAASGATPVVFVNLDMEEYADVHLTEVAFCRVLDEPELLGTTAGIVVQAYLPDSHDVLERVGGWAAQRVARGGAPIKVRIVKGANLAMELVDAEQHGWVAATYATKAETDASYKRLLDSVLRTEWAGAVRVGVASHNLFDVAWALEQHAGDRLEIEMLEGMVPAQARAVQAEAGRLLLYCPIVRADELDASLAYLARRFDENTTSENFLRAMFDLRPGSPAWDEQAHRFARSVAQRADVGSVPNRPGVDAGVAADLAAGRFANEPDSDLTDAATRAAIWAAVAAPRRDVVPTVEHVDEVDAVVARSAAAVAAWSARPAGERAAVLRAAAALMSAERRDAIAVMADEAGKTVREGDPEVSEAIDAARYAAQTELSPAHLPRGVVVVAPPWNFPYAIPAGGVFAALMAGNAVVLKPAPQTPRTAWLLAEQCWRAGVPPDVLQFVACQDGDVGRRLITHPDVAMVVLTGAHATAMQFLEWRPSLHLLAETSGKNAIVVTPSADVDLAVRDVVRSAFGHAGQKCSAASLLILTAEVYDDGRFLRRLGAAIRTLRVGWPSEPATTMGPLIEPPGEVLRRGLVELDDGESWLLRPAALDGSGRLWSPGVRTGVRPGSWFHQTECFGPVLGVMRAADLDHAIELQNATPFGLTGGIHSLDEDEVDRWLRNAEVGNAYVNRHITGAIVRRQPFGGWKRSSVGGGPKAGGPNYVHAFRELRPAPIDVAAARRSYAAAWTSVFAVDHDPSSLRSEGNVLRYRPLRHVGLVAGADTPLGAVDAARAAAELCGVRLSVIADELAPGVERLRVLTSGVGEGLLRGAHAADVAVDPTPIDPEGRFELVHWVREQAVSITRHRHGRLTRARPLPPVRT